MSIPWIWLVRFYRLCYRPFVALLKNLTLPYVLSSFPEKHTAIIAFRFPLVLYSSPTWVINIHPNTRTLCLVSLDPKRSSSVPLLQWRPTISNLVVLMTRNSSPKLLFFAGRDTSSTHSTLRRLQFHVCFFFSLFLCIPTWNLSNHSRSRVRSMSRHSTNSWKVGHVSSSDLIIQAYCKCLLVKWSWHASKFRTFVKTLWLDVWREKKVSLEC